MSSIYEFATWKPLLEFLIAVNPGVLDEPGGHLSGRISRGGSWSLPRRARTHQIQDRHVEYDAVARVVGALDGDTVSFVAEMPSPGRIVLHLLTPSAAVEAGGGPYPESLLLVEGSVPEPWRRLPEPYAGLGPSPGADPELLFRTLEDQLPGAVAATGTEIADAEARLGVALPEELKAVYRVTRARWPDWQDDQDAELTTGREPHRRPGPAPEDPPLAATVDVRSAVSVESVASPRLEVLRLGFWDGEPFSLVPVAASPRLRTLTAARGTLADPREIAALTALEFLALSAEDWRVLLDEDAVPSGLLAAGIEVLGRPNPLPIVDVANKILTLWNRPRITRTILEGDLE